MRLVSQEINTCLGNGPGPRANFGLIFNKWLTYQAGGNGFEPTVSRNRGPLVNEARQVRGAAAEILRLHHVRQACYCKAMEKAGWIPCIFHARLTAPFVSGLGMTHPTETGLVLDHTSGVPYIPASGQKGVLRIAHMINSLQDDDGNWIELDELQKQGVVDQNMNWLEDPGSRTLFGSTDTNKSQAGQLTFLDAYPLQPPELGEEILNPHYNDYYQGNRGPTEDQSPVPVKFLVVRPGAEFVFRVLLRLPHEADVSADAREKLRDLVEKNMIQALTREGLGAKTSLGFGRFEIVRENESQVIQDWIEELQRQQEAAEQELKQKILDRKYPWKKILPRLHHITEWGLLENNVLQHDEFLRFQGEEEVGVAVAEKAREIAERRKKKWTDERDQSVAQWLEPSGVQWQPMAKAAKPATPPPQKDNSKLLAQINAFSDEATSGWKEFKSAKIRINKLDRQCAESLKKKFSTWKLKKSKKKSSEKKAYDNLNKRLKNLT